MKLAFLYGNFSLGNRPLELGKLYTSKRGLTGSELSCIEYARGMARRGHQVELFMPGGGGKLEAVTVRPIVEHTQIDSSYDVAYAWNEPDLLRNVKAKLRMVNQQLNDFNYCHAGFAKHVDLFTSPSESHMAFIAAGTPSGSAWAVVPNGCDLSQYDSGAKVPGRVIYASSPDRGLHWLLECWPDIKRAVPHASLRIFYEMGPWLETFLNNGEVFVINGEVEKGLTETGYRARYIHQALQRLEWLDVIAVGSVSRLEMAKEMSQAECLAYPCDTIRFTEGFSVSTLEGCASGAIPVVTAMDALGSIYGSLPTMVYERKDFADMVIRVLQEPAFAATAAQVGYKLAGLHQWDILCERLEGLIHEAGKNQAIAAQ